MSDYNLDALAEDLAEQRDRHRPDHQNAPQRLMLRGVLVVAAVATGLL